MPGTGYQFVFLEVCLEWEAASFDDEVEFISPELLLPFLVISDLQIGKHIE